MKISFNPSNSNKNILDLIKNNKDIIFDLKGHSIFARGVEFKDTNTWRDIKINNVSIGSHTLDLRNGSNTTLTNTNGVVTINSTWRPVVDNLTSDSTTSSLSAKQGKVLKALIDGKSNSDHNHDGRYVRYYAVTTLDCNNLAAGLTSARISATNAAHTNHSAYLYISDVGTPFQIQIPDSSIPYIYKRYYGSGKWSGWFKLNAGYADSAGSVAWANVTGKPSSYTPSAHTHAWNSLTHSSTTENQAILTNGKANGWKLQTLNIARWDNAANNAHSHANKSVLDGITSALVNSWNTAYNFVSNITGTDTDKVINKWEEIVNFLAGITEDNKLNTLLNSKLSVYELADNTNVGTIKNNGIYYSTTDASSRTLINSPFNTGFAFINMTSYDGGDDLRRSRLAFNAFGEIKVSDDRDQANTAETWYNVLTSKNSGINGSTIKLNGTSITVYSSGTADGRYVKKSGDTMQGNLTFTSGKQTRWTAKGISYITDGNIDFSPSLGGDLANLVISSWYGVSFTTSCSGQTYTNKTAVGINCRTGIVYAANFVGPLQGNAATATKLQTSRSIWGQSFDGTRDVSGTLSGVANIQFSADGAYDIGSNSATSRYIYTNWLGAKSGSKLELGANNSGFGQGLCIDTNLNVGIGTNSPTQKLDVIGNIRATGQLYLPTDGNYNAILMGNDCWMGDCNIRNVIGLSGTNNANSGGIKFGKGGMYIGYNGSYHYSSRTSLWTNFNADTVDGEHASNFSYTHQSSFDFSKRKSGRIVTFDQSGTDYGWINGFASTYNNYLTSVIFNEHRSSNWYVGYMEGDMSTGETNGLQAVHKLAFADGDESYPIFLGYLNLYNGNDGTISGSFPCLGYSVPFTYTRGGSYCLINIPNTSFQTFYIKAAIASVHYSGAGMGDWVGDHRGDGAWWLHCDAVGSNAVQVKGFHPANKNNDSWWGGNPLYSGDGAAKIITVCLFGYVKFR